MDENSYFLVHFSFYFFELKFSGNIPVKSALFPFMEGLGLDLWFWCENWSFAFLKKNGKFVVYDTLTFRFCFGFFLGSVICKTPSVRSAVTSSDFISSGRSTTL